MNEIDLRGPDSPERALIDALAAETDAMAVVRDRLVSVVALVGSDGGSRLDRATRDLEIAAAALTTTTGLREQVSARLPGQHAAGPLSSRSLEASLPQASRALVVAHHEQQRRLLAEIEQLQTAVGNLVAVAQNALARHRRALDDQATGHVTYHDPRRERRSAGRFVAFSA